MEEIKYYKIKKLGNIVKRESIVFNSVTEYLEYIKNEKSNTSTTKRNPNRK